MVFDVSLINGGIYIYPSCYGNEIWNKIDYNSACVNDECEIFCLYGKIFRNEPSNAANRIPPWLTLKLPWQQNLGQNVL